VLQHRAIENPLSPRTTEALIIPATLTVVAVLGAPLRAHEAAAPEGQLANHGWVLVALDRIGWEAQDDIDAALEPRWKD